MEIEITKLAHLTGHQGPLYTLASGKDDETFYSGGSDKLIVAWKFNNPADHKVIAKSKFVVYSILFINELNILLIGNNQGGIHVIDLNVNAEIRYFDAHNNGVFCMYYLKSENKILTGGGDGQYILWNAADFTVFKKEKISNGKIRSIAINETKNIVAFASGENHILIYNLKTFERLYSFEAHTDAVNAVAFDKNGDFLISGGKDAYLKIWNVNNGFELIKEIPAHNYAIYSIQFNYDGSLFATASRDKTIKIWETKDFNFLKRIDKDKFEGHLNSVNQIIWSTTENIITSCSDDGKLMVWKIE
jgi:WD repeat-containing protein 61